MRPVWLALGGQPLRRKDESKTGTTAAMPKPPPRHLEPLRLPWRLMLVAFGLTASVLAALVASAGLVPHDPAPSTPGRPPGGGALSTFPAEPTPTSAATATTRPAEPRTSRTSSTSTPDTARVAASGPATTARPATTGVPARVGRTTTTGAPSTSGATTTEPTVTAPTTTAEPSTTAPTTTLVPTTSAEPTTTTQPTTTEPTTTGPTTTEPATTTTGPPILLGDQPAPSSGATAGALLPVLGLLYLLRGLLPQPGGTHARQRGAKHLRRRS
jgi:hypothetical protein